MKKVKQMLAILMCLILCVTLIPARADAATMKLNKKSASILVTKTVQLKVQNTKKKVKWSTSNKKVATVTAKGLVKGKKVGNATITAKVGAKKFTCKVTVKTGMNVTKKTMKVGDKYTLKVLGATKKVTWSSSKKSVATVTSKGVVTAKMAGTTTITAKVNGKKYACKVTVKSKLNLTKKTVKVGEKFTLKVLGANKKVTYKTSKSSVASVTSKGVVTAKAAGSATITATMGSEKFTCKVTVKKAATSATKPVTPPTTEPEEPITPPTTEPEEPITPPTTEPEEPITPPITEPEEPVDVTKLVDFIVDVPAGREVRVLQLTDTQIIDAAQAREGREGVDVINWATDKMDDRCFNYIRETVKNTNPDLILLTGDLVYGEFDDAGTSLQALIACMEEFEIPWAPIFGNHENESKKGADWQCQQLEAAEHCLFKQRTLTGNGNYTVGIRQGGKVKRVFFMMDSNGCGQASEESLANGHTKSTVGFGNDQIDWYMDTANAIKKAVSDVKLSFAFHIQPYIFKNAFEKYGFKNDETIKNPINIDAISGKAETDFGYIGRDLKNPWNYRSDIWDSFKDLGVDSIFVGHEHCNSASVVYEGVRCQYGQKTGTYDRANYRKKDTGEIVGSYNCNEGEAIVGGTLMVMSEKDGSITKASIYYCDTKDETTDTPATPQPPVTPEKPETLVNGLQYGTELTTNGPVTVTADVIAEENAWKCVANTQGKVFVTPALLTNKTTFQFSVYITTPGTHLSLGDQPEFAIRIKPDSLEPDIDGSANGYIEYSTTLDTTNRKLVANTWQTFTVDISNFGTACTEFSFVIPKGGVIYLKDIEIK